MALLGEATLRAMSYPLRRTPNRRTQEETMRINSTLAAVLFALATPALYAGAQTPPLKWGPAPAIFPAGAKMAVLQGDPGKSGPFVLRLMTPGAYAIPPHWHSQDEQLTVISGTFYFGLGDKVDAKKATGLPAGGFHFLPAKAHHYAFSKAPAVVQVSGNGPFDVTYLNPADDRQKKM